MTELFIDGVAVVLPKGFNIPVKRENALFAKNGEYTYDVTLPLDNVVNATLYKHLNRLNSTEAVKAKRSAILCADNRVYCNGTEIITGWTEANVTIQIASGNSELNYIIGSSLQISFLKMKETTPNKGELRYIEKLYPEVDYSLISVMNRTAGTVVNKWALANPVVVGGIGDYSLQGVGDDWYPQPYLCAYIKELMRALGYNLLVNQIEDTVWKHLCICHAINSCKWNELLPGWRVQAFLEEVEKMFNVVLVIDNRERTVRILQNGSFYTNEKLVHVQNVEDVYEMEVLEETEINQHSKANVRYNLPDNSYYRWRRIPESILKVARKESIPIDYGSGTPLDRVTFWFMQPEHQRVDTIYTDLKTGYEYAYIRGDSSYMGTVYYRVNEFKDIERDGAVDTIELDMVPAEIALQDAVSIFDAEGQLLDTVVKAAIPTVDYEVHDEQADVELSIPDMVDGQSAGSESSSSNQKIFLAFYKGVKRGTLNMLGFYNYPQPFTDVYVPDGSGNPIFINENDTTLRLSKLNDTLYQGGYDIDFARGVKIATYDPNLYSAQSIFEIRNRRYICKDMEFVLDTNGRKGAWTGTFYPIRISDVEADKRWILTDGKWRDGGVWLDNGRWMDEN